jgi:hypothetical protein
MYQDHHIQIYNSGDRVSKEEEVEETWPTNGISMK